MPFLFTHLPGVATESDLPVHSLWAQWQHRGEGRFISGWAAGKVELPGGPESNWLCPLNAVSVPLAEVLLLSCAGAVSPPGV